MELLLFSEANPAPEAKSRIGEAIGAKAISIATLLRQFALLGSMFIFQ